MSSASDAYLNTRVAAMTARLLSPADAARLAAMSLAELAERYGLGTLHEEQLSPRAKNRAVEQALIATLFAEVAVLVRPMSPVERALVLAWGRKFALFNLKTLIRGKLYDLDQTEIRENLYDLPPAVRLPIPDTDLLRAENVLELLRILEDGPYRLIARQAREVYEQQREPFALEAAIDQRYYGELARRVMQFPPASLQPLRRLLGVVLDRVDLLWLMRFRFAYQLSPSETFYHLVPSFRLLYRERLLGLVNSEGFEDLLGALPAPLDALLAGATSPIDVQRRTGIRMAGELAAILATSASAVTRALAYLMLRERDLFLIFGLIQGKLLGLSQDLIEIGTELVEPPCPIVARAA